VKATSIQPNKQYRISVLPEGPPVSSAEEFNKQPLRSTSANSNNSFVFTTQAVPDAFELWLSSSDSTGPEFRPQTRTVEKKVCTAAEHGLDTFISVSCCVLYVVHTQADMKSS
jgi:hypothetical protein